MTLASQTFPRASSMLVALMIRIMVLKPVHNLVGMRLSALIIGREGALTMPLKINIYQYAWSLWLLVVFLWILRSCYRIC